MDVCYLNEVQTDIKSTEEFMFIDSSGRVRCPHCRYLWKPRNEVPVACPKCKRYLTKYVQGEFKINPAEIIMMLETIGLLKKDVAALKTRVDEMESRTKIDLPEGSSSGRTLIPPLVEKCLVCFEYGKDGEDSHCQPVRLGITSPKETECKYFTDRRNIREEEKNNGGKENELDDNTS